MAHMPGLPRRGVIVPRCGDLGERGGRRVGQRVGDDAQRGRGLGLLYDFSVNDLSLEHLTKNVEGGLDLY